MEIIIGLIVGFGFSLFMTLVFMIARAGNLGRASWGLTVAGRANLDPNFGNKVNELLGLLPSDIPATASVPTVAAPVTAAKTAPVSPPPPLPPAASKKPVVQKASGESLRILALLQAESRLIDFLMEDINAANDTQIGQAVRDIHRKAQIVLKQQLSLEPVLSGNEGQSVTVPAGFDPSAIRVLGNVTGKPPYTGELQHPGWRVKDLKVNPLPEGQDPFVVQPAEVQLG
jgi:Domain of unknown function (DUF2760)